MMNLKCPNCNTVFEVDENHYASLLSQVKNAEFEAEIKRRLEELSLVQQAKAESEKAKTDREYEQSLGKKETEINRLNAEIERLKATMASYDSLKKADIESLVARQQEQIALLEAAKDKEIADLKSRIKESDTRHELDLTNQKNASREELYQKEKEITELSSKLESQKTEARNRELELRNTHEVLMKAKDEEIERYKDMKSRLSTKMVGETLEQHCRIAFDTARSNGQYVDAYFEKDNDATGGSKGDFIFRDYINGVECVSIMFEMKNEMDTTATKHKNEDFFSKLDKDRRDKNCEYAVLVSLLEADNDFYNTGIVDVSFKFPKMFVIRPQFFMPIISLLSKAARRNAETMISLRAELVEAKAQSIDVTNFEEKRDRFAAEFMKFVDASRKKYDDAMDAIDKAIANAEKQIDSLRKIKSLFDTSNQKLVRAGEVIENDFTIKKLTHGNPTMKAKFREARLSIDDKD